MTTTATTTTTRLLVWVGLRGCEMKGVACYPDSSAHALKVCNKARAVVIYARCHTNSRNPPNSAHSHPLLLFCHCPPTTTASAHPVVYSNTSSPPLSAATAPCLLLLLLLPADPGLPPPCCSSPPPAAPAPACFCQPTAVTCSPLSLLINRGLVQLA